MYTTLYSKSVQIASNVFRIVLYFVYTNLAMKKGKFVIHITGIRINILTIQKVVFG